MISAGYYAMNAGDAVQFGPLFTLYAISVAFFMPTIGLANSVAFNALTKADINIKMIDQGSSEFNIIIGVDETDFESALKSIYTEFVK